MHLQPMKWVNDWPVIGIDKDGDGCGEPVLTYKKPNVGQTYPICTPQESDEFDGYTLSPQWQWHANMKQTANVIIAHIVPFALQDCLKSALLNILLTLLFF